MKKINLFIILLAAVLMYACAAPDKKAEIADLKKKRDDLSAEIIQLEKELPKDEKVAQKSAIVITAEVAPQTFTHYLEVQGKVDSDQNVKLTS
ncbi:MAG: efflux transporter periplasmic adaptor subunit, partial [Bacteroidia bacterium]|nr:efflux transporter periplasmic adaptor subunit [Bacteroidia bacterium]